MVVSEGVDDVLGPGVLQLVTACANVKPSLIVLAVASEAIQAKFGPPIMPIR